MMGSSMVGRSPFFDTSHPDAFDLATGCESPDFRVQPGFRFVPMLYQCPVSTHLHSCIALPFSNYLYRMNTYTKTPVNTVWFCALLSLALGLLAFAGPQAINAVFAISVTGLYIAYAIPIVARFTGDNEFKPGPFTLGVFVSRSVIPAEHVIMYSCRDFRSQWSRYHSCYSSAWCSSSLPRPKRASRI